MRNYLPHWLSEHFGKGAAVVLWLIMFVFLAWFQFYHVGSSVSPSQTDRSSWPYQCVKFYQTSAAALQKELATTGASQIVVHPEANATDYACSSPCNADLARAVYNAPPGAQNGQVETIFCDCPASTGPVWDTLCEAPDWPLLRNLRPDAHWRRCESGDETTPCSAPVEAPAALHVELEIAMLSLSPHQDTYEAEFVLLAGSSRSAMKPLLSFPAKGKMTQNRWFVRRCSPIWFFWTCLGVLFLMVYLSVVPDGWRPNVYQGAFIGLRVGIMASLFAIFLLYLSPLNRTKADFFQQANIYYLPDVSSEVYGQSSNPTLEGVPELEDIVYKGLRNKVLDAPPSSHTAFWNWISSGHAWRAIYKPRHYELNRPFTLETFAFSGGEGTEWLACPDNATLTIPNLTPRERESRLICPQQELAELIRATADKNDGRMVPSFVLLLTGQCSPCDEDYEQYLSSLSSVDDSIRESVSVFTVVTPSLSRTGARRMYDFEDGKIALASLTSEQLLLLNAPGAEWESLVAKHLTKLPQSCRRKDSESSRQVLRWSANGGGGPLFQIPHLTSQHRHNWATPCDLDELRWTAASNYRLLAKKDDVKDAGDQIISDFLEFTRTPRASRTTQSIHVVGPIFGLWWAVALVLALGMWAFIQQYVSEPYAHSLADSRYTRNSHRFVPILAGLALAMFYFILLWQSEDPQVWTDCGDTGWTLCVVLVAWVAWVAAPHICYWRLAQGVEPQRAAWQATVAVLLIGVGVLAAHHFLPENQTGGMDWLLAGKLALTMAVVLTALLVSRVRIASGGIGGRVEWWRTPWWSGFVKTLLIIALVSIVRGVFPAGPALFVPWSLMGYEGFIVLTIVLVATVGLGIALTQPNWKSMASLLYCAPPAAIAGAGLAVLWF